MSRYEAIAARYVRWRNIETELFWLYAGEKDAGVRFEMESRYRRSVTIGGVGRKNKSNDMCLRLKIQAAISQPADGVSLSDYVRSDERQTYVRQSIRLSDTGPDIIPSGKQFFRLSRTPTPGKEERTSALWPASY